MRGNVFMCVSLGRAKVMVSSMDMESEGASRSVSVCASVSWTENLSSTGLLLVTEMQVG